MPRDLAKLFAEKYRLTKDMVIRNVYQKERPNSYLASFAPFMAAHRLHPYMDKLLTDGFDEFVRTNIMTYPNYWEYKCNFVGSIGYLFDMHLRNVCELHGVQMGKILRSPIADIFHFVVERETTNLLY